MAHFGGNWGQFYYKKVKRPENANPHTFKAELYIFIFLSVAITAMRSFMPVSHAKMTLPSPIIYRHFLKKKVENRVPNHFAYELTPFVIDTYT